MKHVHPKTISNSSQKSKNTIPIKKAGDSSPVDQAYLEHHPHGGRKRFFPDESKHIKQFSVRKQKILPQSSQHTMEEAKNSSPMDHTSTKVTLLLSEFLIPK